MIVDRYYYHQLNKQEQAIYKAFYDDVMAHEEIIPIPARGKFSQESFERIFMAMTRDNPLIYFLNQSACSTASDMFGHIAICPQYFFSKEKVKEYNRKIEKVVNELAGQLRLLECSDYEKEIRIHDWICQNIAYIINVMPDPELLLALNTKRFAQIYMDEYMNESPEEMLIFLKMNGERLPLNWVYTQYIDLIIKSEEFRNEAVERLIVFSEQNLQEQKRTISHADIIKLTLGLRNEDFYLVDKIVQQGTKYPYSIQPMKRYAQLDTEKEKSLKPFKELFEKKIPAKHIIYIYMNTRLRKSVQLNQLIEEMSLIGYTETEVLNAVRDYWIVGRIKHVAEDGIVRVSADSLSVSRLMVFNSNLIHISGKDGGWVLPKKGDMIYYKIRNYLNGGKFYIHYPCEKIEYVLKEK